MEISTTPKVDVGTQFHARHGTKILLVFLLADGKGSCLLLPCLISLLSGGTAQSENTYSSLLKVTGQY